MSSENREKKILRPVMGDGSPRSPKFLFFCPGCKCGHGIWVNEKSELGAAWTFNGDMDRPTFNPSILVHGTKFSEAGEKQYQEWMSAGTPKLPEGHRFDSVSTICHSYVRDGQIQFLSDSTHALAGQTVPLEPF